MVYIYINCIYIYINCIYIYACLEWCESPECPDSECPKLSSVPKPRVPIASSVSSARIVVPSGCMPSALCLFNGAGYLYIFENGILITWLVIKCHFGLIENWV